MPRDKKWRAVWQARYSRVGGVAPVDAQQRAGGLLQVRRPVEGHHYHCCQRTCIFTTPVRLLLGGMSGDKTQMTTNWSADIPDFQSPHFQIPDVSARPAVQPRRSLPAGKIDPSRLGFGMAANRRSHQMVRRVLFSKTAAEMASAACCTGILCTTQRQSLPIGKQARVLLPLVEHHATQHAHPAEAAPCGLCLR